MYVTSHLLEVLTLKFVAHTVDEVIVENSLHLFWVQRLIRKHVLAEFRLVVEVSVDHGFVILANNLELHSMLENVFDEHN